MTKLAISCGAAMLCIAIASQSLAQAANPEPGYCAQFYPNADCNSMGPETPGSRTPQTAAEPEPEQATSAVAPKAANAEKKKKRQSAASFVKPQPAAKPQ